MERTLLLVDDEVQISLDQAEIIKGLGYHVVTAANGEEAVATALRNDTIDLILMDIDLGRGIDGIEAARRILEKRSVPIVFLVSHAERELTERVRGIRRYGCVLKNSEKFLLGSSIEMAFDLYEAHEGLSDTNEQLRGFSDRLLGILDHSSLLISEFDLDGRCRLASRSVGNLLGMEPDDLIGKRFHDLLPVEQAQSFLERIGLVSERNEPMSAEDRILVEGKEHAFSTVFFPLYDVMGRIFSVAGIARDITDNVTLADALLQKNQQLEAANEELQAAMEEMEAANEELLASGEQLLSHQREIEESEARYRSLFNNNHSVMLLIDPETGDIIDANPSACRWYGWSCEEMRRKKITDINTLPPGDIRREMQKAAAEKRNVFFFMHRLANGDVRDVEVYSGPITIKGKGLLYSIVHDITERKRVERAFAEERARMDNILSSLETGLSLINPNMTIAWVNKKIHAMFPGEDPSGKPCYSFFENRTSPCETCGTMETFKTGKSVELERYNQTNGQWYQIISQAVLNERGEVINVLEGIRNITGRKKIEEDLVRSTRIINTGPVIAFSWKNEENWPVEFVSENCMHILGYPATDFLSGRVLYASIIHPDDIERVKREVASNSTDPKISSFRHDPYRIITAEGRSRWVDDITIILRNNEGTITHYQGIIHDISPIKEADADLRRNEARLRSLVEIFQHQPESIQSFLDYALDRAISLTASRVGYIYFYDEESRQFTLNTWSKEVMKECSIQEPRTVYHLDKTGIWGEAVRQRKPVLVNDFQNPNPLKKGYPEGHVELHRFLTVPIIVEEAIVAVVGVGNKESDYAESDVLQLTLMMDAVWKVVEQKKSRIEITRLLEEKELLLREVHHRIKNNMSTVMSLLSLQSQNDAPPAVTTALQDARSRIQSMMIVYDKLYRSADFRNVSLREYLTPLIDEIVASYTISAKITVEKLIDDFPLHAEKLFPVGLILNELLTNAMKYAFNGRSSGRIAVTVSRTASGIVLVVHDDGPGLPEAALSGRSAGFGIKLVEMMMTQVGGTMRIENDSGGRFHITIPF
ncbi:MAG: PAS domain S-box protein [Spirochaetes bacterium]|nr:PAS domain S-box protein [Spirochaetota bacterium]